MENTVNELVIGDIHLLYMDVSGVGKESEYRELSAYRREKVNRLRYADDKKLSIAAELLLIYGIKKYYPDIEIPLSYEITDAGKPELPGVHFSLAHSGSYAVCAIADTAVGVDIERADRKGRGVAERYFSPNECALPLAYIWTRKEAVAKADGRGIAIGLDTFDVSGDIAIVDGNEYNIVTLPDTISGYYLSLAW